LSADSGGGGTPIGIIIAVVVSLLVIVGCPICMNWLIKKKKKKQEVGSSSTADKTEKPKENSIEDI
jgi:flagellar basal body-associated protein FliL